MTWTDLKQNWADGDDFTAAAQNLVAAAINGLVDNAKAALVTTSETTTSTSYADLATTTDSVTTTVGSSGIVVVFLTCFSSNSGGTSNLNYVSFALSGANTQAAADANALWFGGGVNWYQNGATFMLTGLTAGSTTFKMKYKVQGNTGTFQNRRIAVLALP